MSQPIRHLILLLVCVGGATTATATPARLDGSAVRPTAQSIELRLDPSESHYRGAVGIELQVLSETDRFSFHSVGQVFESIRLTGSTGDLEIAHEREGDLVTVRTVEPLSVGRYRLTVEFSAEFGAALEGIYTVERGGEHYAFSVFEPIAARRAFPCWDEPEFKIPFRVTLTVPEGSQAISTGRELEARVVDGWRAVRFAETAPLPSYAVAFAVGPFDTVAIEGLGVPARLITALGRGRMSTVAVATTAELLPRLERYFARPYPYGKLDLLAVPEFPSGGLENAAAVVFSEDVLLVDAAAPVERRLGQAVTVAHELSHMWFGNLVTVEWWDDIWLNEAFATWMAYKVVDEAFPELRADALRQRRVQHAFELDAQTGAPPIRRQFDSPQEAFTVSAPLVYDKGAQVLRMLEGWIGEERFRAGVVAYLAEHAAGNATADDFWRAIDRAAGRPVSTGLRRFLDQPGYPRVDLEVRSGLLELRQERFTHQGQPVDGATWSVPVALKRIEGAESRLETIVLREGDREPRSVSGEVAAGELVFPNASALGYYRWSLPPDRLRALAAAAAEALTPSERLDLLANAGSLLAAGRLGGDAYLEMVSRMAADPDPTVVAAALRALDRVRATFVAPEVEPDYARYVERTLRPAWQRVGPAPRGGESAHTTALRVDLYRAIGRDGGDETLRRHARDLVRALLSDGDATASAEPIEPTLVAAALQLAAREGGEALFDSYLERLAATESPGDRLDLIAALGMFPESDLRRRALDAYLDGALDVGELLNLTGALLRDRAGGDTLWAWFTERHDELSSRFPPFLRSFLPLFASGCSAERLAAAETFFAPEERRVAGTERQLAQVGQQVRDCVGLVEREAATVERYLASPMP